MLTIYKRGVDKIPEDKKFVNDVELEFETLNGIKDTELNRKIMKDIDSATYKDEGSFIDRFGTTLYNDCLSTGCKAVLIVNNNPDRIVNTIECGDNALDILINNCKDGAILVSNDFCLGEYKHD